MWSTCVQLQWMLLSFHSVKVGWIRLKSFWQEAFCLFPSGSNATVLPLFFQICSTYPRWHHYTVGNSCNLLDMSQFFKQCNIIKVQSPKTWAYRVFKFFFLSDCVRSRLLDNSSTCYRLIIILDPVWPGLTQFGTVWPWHFWETSDRLATALVDYYFYHSFIHFSFPPFLIKQLLGLRHLFSERWWEYPKA